MQTIDAADDVQPADGELVLSFPRARRKADDLVNGIKDSLDQKQRAVKAGKSYTVEDTVTNYLDCYKLNR